MGILISGNSFFRTADWLMIQKYPVSKTVAVAKTKIYLQKATDLMQFEELSMTMYTFDRKMIAYKTINCKYITFQVSVLL